MIRFNSMDEAYYFLVEQVSHNGFECSPRGRKSKEIRPASFSIMDACQGIYRGKSRRLNYGFMFIEAMCYVAGVSGQYYADIMCKINKKLKSFVNKETGAFDGEYSRPISSQLPFVIEELCNDIYTRRAVISIWNENVKRDSLDVPCTTSLQYFIEPTRSGELLLSCNATMRSNDLNWGTPYDVGIFCIIQTMVAGILGIYVGAYNHFAGSLHIYTEGENGEKEPNVVEPCMEEWYNDDRFSYIRPPYESTVGMTKNEELMNLKFKFNAILSEIHTHLVYNNGRLSNWKPSEYLPKSEYFNYIYRMIIGSEDIERK